MVVFFFLTDSRSSKGTQDCAWESGVSPPYDTVDPRNAGHMAKTQSSHAYTRGPSNAVGKTATPSRDGITWLFKRISAGDVLPRPRQGCIVLPTRAARSAHSLPILS